jgi:hypothetical protein
MKRRRIGANHKAMALGLRAVVRARKSLGLERRGILIREDFIGISKTAS